MFDHHERTPPNTETNKNTYIVDKSNGKPYPPIESEHKSRQQNAAENQRSSEQAVSPQFAKISKIHQLIRDATLGIADGTFQKKMQNAILQYMNAVCVEYETACTSTLNCLKLASILRRTTYLVHSISGTLRKIPEYMHRISEITGCYIACELCAALRGAEPRCKIVQRIIVEVDAYVTSPDTETSKRNLLLMFVAIPNMFNQHEIMCHMYRHYISAPDVVIQEELPDKVYIQYIIVFYQWLQLEVDVATQDCVIDFADRFMRPAATLASNPNYMSILPKYTARRTATRFILENFSLLDCLNLKISFFNDNKSICTNYEAYNRCSISNRTTSELNHSASAMSTDSCVKMETNAMIEANKLNYQVTKNTTNNFLQTTQNKEFDHFEKPQLLNSEGIFNSKEINIDDKAIHKETTQNQLNIFASKFERSTNDTHNELDAFSSAFPEKESKQIQTDLKRNDQNSNELTIISNIQVATCTPFKSQISKDCSMSSVVNGYSSREDSIHLIPKSCIGSSLTSSNEANDHSLDNVNENRPQFVDNAVQTENTEDFRLFEQPPAHTASNTAASCTSTTSTHVLFTQPADMLRTSQTSNNLLPHDTPNQKLSDVHNSSDDTKKNRKTNSRNTHLKTKVTLKAGRKPTIRTFERKDGKLPVLREHCSSETALTPTNSLDTLKQKYNNEEQEVEYFLKPFCEKTNLEKRQHDFSHSMASTKSVETLTKNGLEEKSSLILSTTPVPSETSSIQLSSTSGLCMVPMSTQDIRSSSSIFITSPKISATDENVCFNISPLSSKSSKKKLNENITLHKEVPSTVLFNHKKFSRIGREHAFHYNELLQKQRENALKREQERKKRREQEFEEEQKRLMAKVMADCKRAAEEANEEKLANREQRQRRKSVDLQQIKAAVMHRENLQNINKILKHEAEQLERQLQVIKNIVGSGKRSPITIDGTQPQQRPSPGHLDANEAPTSEHKLKIKNKHKAKLANTEQQTEQSKSTKKLIGSVKEKLKRIRNATDAIRTSKEIYEKRTMEKKEAKLLVKPKNVSWHEVDVIPIETGEIDSPEISKDFLGASIDATTTEREEFPRKQSEEIEQSKSLTKINKIPHNSNEAIQSNSETPINITEKENIEKEFKKDAVIGIVGNDPSRKTIDVKVVSVKSASIQTEFIDSPNQTELSPNLELAEKETQTNLNEVLTHERNTVVQICNRRRKKISCRRKCKCMHLKKKTKKKPSLEKKNSADEICSRSSYEKKSDIHSTTISLTNLATRAANCQARVDSLLNKNFNKTTTPSAIKKADNDFIKKQALNINKNVYKATNGEVPSQNLSIYSTGNENNELLRRASQIRTMRSHYRKLNSEYDFNRLQNGLEMKKMRYLKTDNYFNQNENEQSHSTASKRSSPIWCDTAYSCREPFIILDSHDYGQLHRHNSGGDCLDSSNYALRPPIIPFVGMPRLPSGGKWVYNKRSNATNDRRSKADTNPKNYNPCKPHRKLRSMLRSVPDIWPTMEPQKPIKKRKIFC